MGHIAKISGFSIKTVSRVVNNEKSVSDKTRKEILRVIRKYDFKPNIFAKNLKKRKSYTVGLIVHNITNPYMPELIETIEREISQSHDEYSILLSISDISEKSKRECIRNMIDKMVDGLIITNMHRENQKDLEYLKGNSVPFVLVLNRLNGFESNYVGADFYFGSIKMMSYLYGLGLRKIAFITGTPDNISSAERLQGYKSFLLKHDLSCDDSLIETGDFKYAGGFSAFNKLLSRNPDLEAVFCVNDYTALGALDAARKLQIKVPDDLVIVGFDDMHIASHSNIGLTTMRIPILKMAKAAVRILFGQIDGKKKRCQKVILKPELVIR